MKDWQLHLQKVTSISIHHLTSYMSYKRCHMTFVQVVEHNPPYEKEKGHENLVPTPRVTFEITSYQATC
jgi:hypothetical protein